jgi:hypothetical protein
VRWQALEQCGNIIRAVDVQIRRTPALTALCREWHRKYLSTASPHSGLDSGRFNGIASDTVLEAERGENLHRIGRYLNTRTHLAKGVCLFQHNDLMSKMRAAQRGCQTANTPANDQNFHMSAAMHARPVSGS